MRNCTLLIVPFLKNAANTSVCRNLRTKLLAYISGASTWTQVEGMLHSARVQPPLSFCSKQNVTAALINFRLVAKIWPNMCLWQSPNWNCEESAQTSFIVLRLPRLVFLWLFPPVQTHGSEIHMITDSTPHVIIPVSFKRAEDTNRQHPYRSKSAGLGLRFHGNDAYTQLTVKMSHHPNQTLQRTDP